MTKEGTGIGRQASKAKLTREKIIAAVIALIREGGISCASSSRIAERAGISWGAAQHHFGSKEEILDSILDTSHQDFVELMADPALCKGPSEHRVQLFIDRMWQHYQSDIYHAALEILLAARSPEGETFSLWTEQIARGHLITLRKIFHDFKLSDLRMLEALEFVHCFLTGLTIERIFEGNPRSFTRQLSQIKQVLLAILSRT